MFVWVSLMFTFVDCVLGGCACNWDSRCDCVSSIFKLYLACWWAWNLQRRPFVMTLANITGDGLDHSQNCLIPIHSSPMNLGFRCLLDRSSLDCRQRQKGCRAWETMQRLKIEQKYVSYFVYVRIINVLDIDISMAFVIISIPGKTCQFSPISFPTFCWSKDSYESCWTFCGPTTMWPKNMLALMKQKPRGVEASNCWDSYGFWPTKAKGPSGQADVCTQINLEENTATDRSNRLRIHKSCWKMAFRIPDIITFVTWWSLNGRDEQCKLDTCHLKLRLKPRHPSSERWCHPADAQ